MENKFNMNTQCFANENVDMSNRQCTFTKPRINTKAPAPKPMNTYSMVNTIHPSFYSTQPKNQYDVSPELLRKLMQ